MRKGSKAFASGVGLVALATAVAACGGSGSSSGSSGKSSGGSTSLSSGTQGINPGSGTPKSGGTLNMLGQGDVDYIDYNISYYSIGELAQRLYQRYLYDYPAVPGKTTTVAPDLATAAPVVSNGGKTYSVTIRTGAMWDTTPARQVTAADALRGIERSCNGVQPFGGLPDFESLIVGYSDFCTGFAKATTPAAMKSYLASHSPSGIKVSGQTISYTLVHPASYFPGQLELDAFAPAPIESLNYVPASAAAQQHEISDGPYQIQSYTPARQITFVRNPAWKASSDPIRKAYVNKIVVSETGNQASVQQQLQTNSANASMEFDAFPPLQSTAGLDQADAVGAEPQLQPRHDGVVEPVHRVQPGLAEQRQRAEQGRGAAGAQLRHQPGPPGPGHQPGGQPAADARSPGRPGRHGLGALGLQPVPVQPDQGQVHAGHGRVQLRPEHHHAVPAGLECLDRYCSGHPV